MAKRSVTYCLVMAAGILLTSVQAQTVHPYGLDQLMGVTDNSLSGTPRFIGMAGAMTAVGGDPSAVKQNPAGLGIYRHNQFSLSADGTFSRYWQTGADRGALSTRWHLSQVSFVFAMTHPERVVGVVSNNLMISFVRRADIRGNVLLNDRQTKPASATNWLETNVEESGYRNDVDFHYAMNISNRVYWGVGLTMEWMYAWQDIDRWEYTAADRRGLQQTYALNETFTGRYVGVGGSLGVLAHPIQMLRLGLAVESPVLGRMRETDHFTERLKYPDAPAANINYDSPDYNSNWQVVTPLKVTAGVGLQWKEHGLLSLQYDLQYHKTVGVSHIARAGLEVAMSNHWMLEGGYSYSTLFSRQQAALGVHYMGKWIRVGIAYTYAWSTGKVLDSLYLDEQGVYRTGENKIVFSFQWNS